MSAPFRYARILKGLSLLISRRSAISRRILAMAGLSNLQTFRLDVIVEQMRPSLGEGVGDRRPCVRRTKAEEAPAAACATDLGAGGARSCSPADQVFDGGRRHAGGEALPVGPLLGDLTPHRVPVAALKTGPHGHCGVTYAFETVEHVAIAIEVSFDDLPVIRAGLPWGASVGQDDAAFELDGIDIEADPRNAADRQFDGSDAAVECRAIVLDAGRHTNGLALDIHGDLQQIRRFFRCAGPSGECAAD